MAETNAESEGSSLAQALSAAHVASFTSNNYRCATFSTGEIETVRLLPVKE